MKLKKADIKKAFSQKSIMRSWFISYILILATTIFVNMFIYNETQNSLTRQIHATSAESLENSKQRIDNLRKNLQNLVSTLAMDRTLLDMLDEKKVDGVYRYKMTEVQQQLSAKTAQDTAINNIYIYIHENDYIVSKATIQTAESFYKSNYAGKEMDFDAFRNLLRKKSAGDFERIANKGQNIAQSDVLFMYSVNGAEIFVPKATIVCEMKNSAVTAQNDMASSGRYFCILDRNNEVFLSNAEANADINKILSIMTKKKLNSPVMSKKAVLVYTNSEQSDWKYVYVIEKNVYLKELQRVRVIIYVTVILCLVLGIFLAYFLSVYNHKPVRKLIEQLGIKEMSAQGEKISENEFQLLDRKVNEILEDNELKNSKIVSQNLIIRDAVFLKLLNNEMVSGVSMKELLSSIDVSFEMPYFVLIGFYFNDLSGLFFEEKTEITDDDANLSKLIISNILDDIVGAEYKKIFCDINGVFSCIINTSDIKCEDTARKAVSELLKFAQNNFNLGFTACISQIHEGIEGLSACQKEVAECLEYKFIVGNDIINYRDISETQTNLYYFPIGQEVQMISSLKDGDYEKSLEILNNIFEINLSQAKPQIQTAKCLVYDILGSVMKVLNDIGDIDGNNIFQRFNVFERIDKCHTVLSIKDELISIFKEICEQSLNESVEKNNRLIENIKNFIESYYDDANLSGAMIADHFKINQSYLSTIFKRNTAQGLLEYIAKIRVTKAIKLLEESSDTIEKIAEKVGYFNVRTFSRTFKKYVGETPGKYRENLQK
ncbi:MAG: AraC family transcriptional regulator [Clostridia bacterium]|nr:AraC family transcriptional regulator [Clostridia bacterium]